MTVICVILGKYFIKNELHRGHKQWTLGVYICFVGT